MTEQLRLSPSSILTYLRCPREFYYTYILRLPKPTTPPMVKGNIVHKTFELFFGGKYIRDLSSQVEECFIKAWGEYEKDIESLKLSPEEVETHRRDCLNMVDMYMRTFNIKISNLIESGKAENERHAFYLLRPKFRELWLEDKELGLCGYIDRIHKDFHGNIIIGDYKTSNRYGIGMPEDYVLQCALYALLYKRCEGILASYCSIIFMRFGEEVTMPITPDIITLALEKLQYVRERTKSTNIEDYPLVPSRFCSYCPFFDKCSGIEGVEDELRRDRMIKMFKEKME